MIRPREEMPLREPLRHSMLVVTLHINLLGLS